MRYELTRCDESFADSVEMLGVGFPEEANMAQTPLSLKNEEEESDVNQKDLSGKIATDSNLARKAIQVYFNRRSFVVPVY